MKIIEFLRKGKFEIREEKELSGRKEERGGPNQAVMKMDCHFLFPCPVQKCE
jgi:hypothetical protein